MKTSHKQSNQTGLELLSKSQVAKLLNLSVATIGRLMYSRKLPFIKVLGSIRFSAKDVEKFLEECRVGSVNEHKYGNKKKT